ncbi:Crp/Fnr family transcriptional regulator [Nocardioides sp. GXZ039]|uniref:Crp/Fnr family transcriptional regulator n=1 Tax=Nocardioides sp. GXZ039 TaxID=3136018 RepID=UPI0030F3D84C
MEWPLFAALQDAERESLLALARPRRFDRNEVVCHAGDPADSLHLVEAGHLAVRGALPSGNTATFRVLAAGDYFGELALLRKDGLRTASVVALEPSRTLVIAGTTFRRLLESDPRMGVALSALLADRIDQLSGRLLETMYVGLDRRVYGRLLELATSYGIADNRASIPLGQTSIADLVGATRPSVNQVLQRLARDGLVEIRRGGVDLLDVAELTRRAGWSGSVRNPTFGAFAD